MLLLLRADNSGVAVEVPDSFSVREFEEYLYEYGWCNISYQGRSMSGYLSEYDIQNFMIHVEPRQN